MDTTWAHLESLVAALSARGNPSTTDGFRPNDGGWGCHMLLPLDFGLLEPLLRADGRELEVDEGGDRIDCLHCWSSIVGPGRGAMECLAVAGQLQMAIGDRIVWAGRPDGGTVHRVHHLPGSPDAVVVLHWEDRPSGIGAEAPFPNLLRVSPDGRTLWRAEPFSGDPSFVDVHVEGDEIIAVGRSGRGRIDRETGQLLSFTPAP